MMSKARSLQPVIQFSTDRATCAVRIAPDAAFNADLWSTLLPSSAPSFLVVDEKLNHLYAEQLHQVLSNHNIFKFVLPSGEAAKTWENCQDLTNFMLSRNVERGSTLIAFGGGSIGDVAGFTASITMRGIKWINVPTTLLAQVDSSIGGKTAINTKHGKNMVGSFHLPSHVVIAPSLLTTLPKRATLSGYVELLKHALICDAELFDWLDTHDILNEPDLLTKAITKSIYLKLSIINGDWTDQVPEKRERLNLGHTFGHAFEAMAGSEQLTHGEAVALGICAAFDAAHWLGNCATTDVLRVKTHLKSKGINTDYTPYFLDRFDSFMNYLGKDKKRVSQSPRFILPTRIGNVYIEDDFSLTAFADYARSIKLAS